MYMFIHTICIYTYTYKHAHTYTCIYMYIVICIYKYMYTYTICLQHCENADAYGGGEEVVNPPIESSQLSASE